MIEMKYVLTIAGSDSCGGAGIQADIKTITSLGAHPLTVITAITSQNSMAVSGIYEVPESVIQSQIEAILKDIQPNSVKTGMMPSEKVIMKVAGVLKKSRLKNIVVDPVIKASTGRGLMTDSAVNALKNKILPLASVVTPNLYEAGILTEMDVKSINDMERASIKLKELGPDVVVTGGHLDKICVDILYDGREIHYFEGEKIDTYNTHGSGCVFSASLATYMAIGNDIVESTRLAHDFTRKAIKNSYSCGKGAGVVRPGH